ncbi:hypothetical protein CCMA1212_009664 [Trichoderma ghanense]|uniref:Uncharacterized protein n=1 Tax=Trichoderma ghanense TaxID=65468 RepID=A0ABY2GRB4_9HYPO
MPRSPDSCCVQRRRKKRRRVEKGPHPLFFSIKPNMSLSTVLVVAPQKPERDLQIHSRFPKSFRIPPRALRSARYPAGGSAGSVRCYILALLLTVRC